MYIGRYVGLGKLVPRYIGTKYVGNYLPTYIPTYFLDKYLA
jgi:hypothetical protein